MSEENYSIEFLRTALKELSKLPKDVQQRIADKIEQLKTNPYPPGVKALTNGNGRLRVRVADYRVVYRIEEDKLVILIIKVGHRRNIYK
ncbi:MAG: type II toxin-antitoxin system RelE/ParE family toxin [Coleofasciculus sp. Co-bin14]|nr:type II toxin-antitoxin system RelE/ParE family toxin [Coleofasciculus sp. Co-bin14]MBD0390672.1 type II toxin-antitoxin system RelE/ParE family toxin [Nostoc sp. C3-bin3]